MNYTKKETKSGSPDKTAKTGVESEPTFDWRIEDPTEVKLFKSPISPVKTREDWQKINWDDYVPSSDIGFTWSGTIFGEGDSS